MASIGNANIINDFKNAYNEDKNKQVLKSFPRNEQLSIVLLRRNAMQNDNIDETDYELMMKYTDAVDELESDSDEALEPDSDEGSEAKKRKRRAQGFTKKRKNNKSNKRKSKKQRKIKKKSNTFKRF
jgi:hypothetical protein